MRLPSSPRRRLTAMSSLLPVLALLPISPPALQRSAAAGQFVTPVTCPAAAVAVIDGLYRWHVAHQRDSGPLLLNSQRERFTPQLYSQLVRALAMTPADGGFVDFDVFSGTQVSTFAASVRSCRAVGAGLEALVAVQAGLRRRPDGQPQLLTYSLVSSPGGSWRIADITYPGNPRFQLSGYLGELLRPKP